MKLPKSEMSLSVTDLPGRSPGVGCAKPLRAKTEVHPSRARGQLQTQRQEVVPSAVCVSELVHALLRRQPGRREKLRRSGPPRVGTLQALCLRPAGGMRTQGEGAMGLPALPSPPAPSVSEDVAADAGTFRVRRGRTGCLREGHCLLSAPGVRPGQGERVASQSCQWPTCSTVQATRFPAPALSLSEDPAGWVPGTLHLWGV